LANILVKRLDEQIKYHESKIKELKKDKKTKTVKNNNNITDAMKGYGKFKIEDCHNSDYKDSDLLTAN